MKAFWKEQETLKFLFYVHKYYISAMVGSLMPPQS